jgi:hypothetical protein
MTPGKSCLFFDLWTFLHMVSARVCQSESQYADLRCSITTGAKLAQGLCRILIYRAAVATNFAYLSLKLPIVSAITGR